MNNTYNTSNIKKVSYNKTIHIPGKTFMLVKTQLEFMDLEHMTKNGCIPFHTQRNVRYLITAPIYNKNKLYNQDANLAIARRSTLQFD